MRTLVSLLGAATAVRSLSMPSSTAERRTILVTGSTDGIGKFTAGKLAADGQWYYYYRNPSLLDVKPLGGPSAGSGAAGMTESTFVVSIAGVGLDRLQVTIP